MEILSECTPDERSGHVAVTWGDYMYVWGGFNAKERRQDPLYIYKYNIYNYKWSRHAFEGSVPNARSGSCYTLIKDKLVVFAGRGLLDDLNDICILHLPSLKWKFPTPAGLCPSPRNKLACCTDNDRVVFFGGYGTKPVQGLHLENGIHEVDDLYSSYGWINDLFSYDYEKVEWIPLANTGDRPSSRAAHTLTALSDKAYLFGGRHKEIRLNDLHVLCLETEQWTLINGNFDQVYPVGRSWHSLIAISSSELFLFGGLDSDGYILCDAWILETSNCKWRSVPDKKKYRLWHTACNGSFKGQVFIFGGCITNIFFDPIYTNDVLEFNIYPKTLQQTCLEILAKNNCLFDDLQIPSNLCCKILKMTIDDWKHQ